MQEHNLLEELVAVSPGMEIWWDSSPLVFDSWTKKMLGKASDDDRATLRRQFKRMFNPDDPRTQLIRGVTTNPPLSLQAIRDDPARWQAVAARLIEENAGLDKERLFWLLYKEVVRRGSDMMLPLFEASEHKEGYLSAQLDPRRISDKEAMLQQAEELHAINPNVMVKVPGTKEGYEVIEELTSRGVATNNTLCYVLPQIMDCARSVKRGLQKAREAGVDLSNWRSVITQMEARYGDLGGLRDFARQEGIELTEADVRTAELAIFKKAYRMIREGGYPSKMLSCSLRLGPTIDGVQRIWHLEEKAGADVVVTCPPPYIDQIINFPHPESIALVRGRIDAEPPREVLDKLLRVPYFERAYREDGYLRSEYNTHPALVKTAEEFSKATEEMVQFAEEVLESSGAAARRVA
jgi:transaldolase